VQLPANVPLLPDGPVSATDPGWMQTSPALSSETWEPPQQFPGGQGFFGEHGRLGVAWESIKCDHRNYYSWTTAWNFAGALSVGSILANTSIDQDVRNWYQRDVRSSGTDNVAKAVKVFGEGAIMIPSAAGLWMLGSLMDDRPAMSTLGEFGGRVTRGYLVGGPPVLLMQYALGASRPSQDEGSQWNPFHRTHGVSGHAFISAVPFITAAQMTDNYYLKGVFLAGSTVTAWSRVNDDAHYLSQVVLGWWMAYMACNAVNETEQGHRAFRVEPLITPEMSGAALIWRR